MEQCSRIRWHGTIRLPSCANAWNGMGRTAAAARDAAAPTGDNSLPTVPKSRWNNHKNKQRERDDEDFSEQARCSAARRIGWDRRPGRRRHPRRAIRRATSPRSSRSRAGNANDITARIVLEQVGKQLGQTIVIDNRGGAGGTIGVGAGGAGDAGRLHHPVPFGVVQRGLRHAQDAALRHVQRFHRGGARSAFRRACWWPRRRRATRPPPI